MSKQIFHKLENKNNVLIPEPAITIVVVSAVIILAIISGNIISGLLIKNSDTANLPEYATNKEMTSGKYGKKDNKMCPDQAEGVLRKGGVEDEGTHHLTRKGGESQNVYLTSSTIDLDKLVGKKVEVWGKTYAAQQAGWLMDACYIEVK
jgi:hypothetical protein